MPSGMLRAAPAVVHMLRASATCGQLSFGNLRLACAIGRAGVSAMKREGDGACPRGLWRIEEILYRADRVNRPRTGLPVREMKRQDAWCDVTGDANYNRLVQLPYPVLDEQLWRDDHLYDIVGVLDYNRVPRVQGLGCAIFLHVARPGHLPTAGCVALAMPDLLKFLACDPAAILLR